MAAPEVEVETLKAAVARRFSVYGVVVTPLSLTFQVGVPPGGFDQAFDDLRKDLVPKDYIPSITQERGELLVHVQRRPPRKYTRVQVNLIMLLATIATTVLFGGAYNWSGYTGDPWLSVNSIVYGTIFFAAPLLAILGCHEMGHYLVSKRYGIEASLPFFIPSFPPLGTFGAFISMRDPLPNRRALLDVGASGPLVGFALAIPITIAGLYLGASNPHPALSAGAVPQASVLYAFLALFFPISASRAPHPLAFAGWVGLFVTAINLLPASQLDGGHIARGLLGRRQYYSSLAALVLLIALSTQYYGWIVFAFFILFIGLRHPPPLNDLGGLGVRQTIVGLVAVAVLLTTFVPIPFVVATPGVTFQDLGGHALSTLNATAAPGTTAVLSFLVNDTSALPADVRLSFDAATQNLRNAGFTAAIANVTVGGNLTPVGAATASFGLTQDQAALVNVVIGVPSGATATVVPWSFAILAAVQGGETISLGVELTVS